MREYISREAVNDTINETAYEYEEDKAQTALYHAADRLNDLPAADVVKVVRGKWEMNSNYPDRLICSECGAQFDCWHWEAKQMHYCPSCGAKMDGGQDDA